MFVMLYGLQALVDRANHLFRRARVGFGGFFMFAWWGVTLSVAVWVGFLVLFGVVDDAGVVMASFLEDTFDSAHFHTIEEIRARVIQFSKVIPMRASARAG